MLSLTKSTARRALLAAGAFATVLLFVAPASADHGRYGRRYYGGHPRVAVVVGLPPIVIGAARPVVYEDYDYRPSRYERGYEDGYEDGYDDRAYQEWRRRAHYRRHHHHHDCDD
jgi:hypothetical protein